MEEDELIRLIRDGDTIIIDPRKNLMHLDISTKEIQEREKVFVPYKKSEIIIPMPLRQYARGNPNPRTGSLSLEF